VRDEEIFYEVTRVLFSHRRKKVKNSLLIEELISPDEGGIIPYGDMRVEKLSPREIGEICDIIADTGKYEGKNKKNI